MQVFFGSADTNTQQPAAVARVDVTAQYLAGGDDYDAALLTLSQPLAGYGGPQVNRIPFAGAGELAAAVGQGQAAVATGWGLTSNNGCGDQPSSRPSSCRSVPTTRAVRATAPSFSPPLGVCAGGTGAAPENNPDTCNGDSGGPLAIAAGGRLKLAGITSFGQECGLPSTPAVYTEASNDGDLRRSSAAGLECTGPSPAAPSGPGRWLGTPSRPSARITSPELQEAHLQLPRARLRHGGHRALAERARLPPCARLPDRARATQLPHGPAQQDREDEEDQRRLQRQDQAERRSLPPGCRGRRRGGQPVEGGAQAVPGEVALTVRASPVKVAWAKRRRLDRPRLRG